MTASSILRTNGQGAMWLVGFGHGTTHWIMATFFIVLPFVAQDLGLSYAQAGALVSTFYVSSFLANFVSGAIVDLTGRRVLFQIVALISGAASIIGFALSSTFLVMCAAIAVVGASNNLWHPPAISFLSQEYPSRRGYALSIHALFASIADAIAPLMAGIFIAMVAWQGTSALSAVPSLVAAAMLVMLLSRDGESSGQAKARMNLSAYRAGLGAQGLVYMRHGKPDVQVACIPDPLRPLASPDCASALDAEGWLYRTADGPLSIGRPARYATS